MSNVPGFDKKQIGSWDQWAIHVINTLDDCKEKHENTKNSLSKVKYDFLVFKTKSDTKATIWGAIAGFVASGIVSLVIYFLNSGGNG